MASLAIGNWLLCNGSNSLLRLPQAFGDRKKHVWLPSQVSVQPNSLYSTSWLQQSPRVLPKWDLVFIKCACGCVLSPSVCVCVGIHCSNQGLMTRLVVKLSMGWEYMFSISAFIVVLTPLSSPLNCHLQYLQHVILWVPSDI